MPVLPLIDLMLLSGWTALLIGFVLKAIAMLTRRHFAILTLTPTDFLMIALAAFLFAIALAARTWVASQAPAQSAARRRDETLEAYRALHRGGGAGGGDGGGGVEPEEPGPEGVLAPTQPR